VFFHGERKLLKNRERWKNFQYSVYSLGAIRAIWASVVCNLDQSHDWLHKRNLVLVGEVAYSIHLAVYWPIAQNLGTWLGNKDRIYIYPHFL